MYHAGTFTVNLKAVIFDETPNIVKAHIHPHSTPIPRVCSISMDCPLKLGHMNIALAVAYHSQGTDLI